MKRIFIHIGTVKTGSTALQKSLGNLAERQHIYLVDRDVVLIFWLQCMHNMPWLSGLAKICFLQRLRLHHARFLISEIDTMVITDENFCVPLQDISSIQRSHQLWMLLGNVFPNYSVILTLRSDDEFIQSLWFEMFCSGLAFSSLDTFFARKTNILHSLSEISSFWRTHAKSYIYKYESTGYHNEQIIKLIAPRSAGCSSRISTRENVTLKPSNNSIYIVKAILLIFYPFWKLADILETIISLLIEYQKDFSIPFPLLRICYILRWALSRINIRKYIRLTLKSRPA